MQTFLFISLGAILGANTRYWLTDWAANRWAGNYPVGTFLINISGSLLLGLLLTLMAERLSVDTRLQTLLIVGFLGSYTTFSTYTNDSMMLLLSGNWSLGLLNLVGSALAGGIAAALGIALGRMIT
jgi:CrcB protein